MRLADLPMNLASYMLLMSEGSTLYVMPPITTSKSRVWRVLVYSEKVISLTVALAPIAFQLSARTWTTLSRVLLPWLVMMSKASFRPPLARTPSAPTAQPAASSIALALLGSYGYLGTSLESAQEVAGRIDVAGTACLKYTRSASFCRSTAM